MLELDCIPEHGQSPIKKKKGENGLWISNQQKSLTVSTVTMGKKILSGPCGLESIFDWKLFVITR